MIWVNGEHCDSLPVMDRGLQYGDGVWETLAVRQGKVMQRAAHLARLQRGVTALAIRGFEPDRLLQYMECAIEAVDHRHVNVVLKIIVTRGSGGRGYSPRGCDQPTYIVTLYPWPDYPEHFSRRGVDLMLCQTRLSRNSALAGFKHLNRLEQVLARSEVGQDFQEGLVRDTADQIIEATMSNLFLVRDETRLVTPSLQNCGIEGIARSCIISVLLDMKVDVVVMPLTLEEVVQAKGLFLTNSIIKIWPVKQFQETTYNIPAVVRRLQERIQNLL